MYPVEILKFLNRKETPGSDAYSPNFKAVKPEGARIRFTTGPARRHDFINSMTDRSPGPANNADPPPRKVTGGAFSKTKRDHDPINTS